MKYFQVIITFPNKNAPKVYLIPINEVVQETRERMDKERGDFPRWCIPGGKDCDAVCDIGKIGVPVNLYGNATKGLSSYEIAKTFWYTVG